jgi:hypothetical protein
MSIGCQGMERMHLALFKFCFVFKWKHILSQSIYMCVCIYIYIYIYIYINLLQSALQPLVGFGLLCVYI